MLDYIATCNHIHLLVRDTGPNVIAGSMQLIAARISRAETLVLHAVGHSAYWEQPDVFNAAVVSFLAKH